MRIWKNLNVNKLALCGIQKVNFNILVWNDIKEKSLKLFGEDEYRKYEKSMVIAKKFSNFIIDNNKEYDDKTLCLIKEHHEFEGYNSIYSINTINKIKEICLGKADNYRASILQDEFIRNTKHSLYDNVIDVSKLIKKYNISFDEFFDFMYKHNMLNDYKKIKCDIYPKYIINISNFNYQNRANFYKSIICLLYIKMFPRFDRFLQEI